MQEPDDLPVIGKRRHHQCADAGREVDAQEVRALGHINGLIPDKDRWCVVLHDLLDEIVVHGEPGYDQLGI